MNKQDVMNKTDLAKVIAEETEISQAKAKDVLNCALDTIAVALADGDSVQLVGFGTFSTAERSEREGRNPKTGEALTIPAKTVAKFKAGKALVEVING